jgi:peptide/nickel transport system permease protein
MATERQDSAGATFEDIDWHAKEVRTSTATRRDYLELGAFAVLILTFVYDYSILQNEGPLILNWDVLSIEWMFIATLVMLFFHVVVPLYDRPRLRKFYWRRFKKNKVAVASLVYLVAIFIVGIFGPALMSPPEVSFRPGGRLVPPMFITSATASGEMAAGSMAHPLGTTQEGRDVLKLVIYGMRVSMQVGLISMVFSILMGSVVGTLAAFATSVDAGMVDEALMRWVDIQSVFPVFMTLLLLTYLFGSQLWMIVLLFGFFGWEGIARTVRGEALQRAEEEYIMAAQAAGADTSYVLRRHLIPNSSNSIITLATLSIPGFILGEASLAFLGFSDPDTFSWGRSISSGQGYLEQGWWVSLFPGIFLFFTVLAFNFIGEAARDALDPRHQGEKGGGL